LHPRCSFVVVQYCSLECLLRFLFVWQTAVVCQVLAFHGAFAYVGGVVHGCLLSIWLSLPSPRDCCMGRTAPGHITPDHLQAVGSLTLNTRCKVTIYKKGRP